MVRNNILVEFDFIIDLDLAMIKFIRDKYNNPAYVKQEMVNIDDDNLLIYFLLHRRHINPLELIFDGINPTNLYFEIIDNNLEQLLEYATVADTFKLIITFLKEATFVDITVLCKNDLQKEFINKLNPKLKTIVHANKMDVALKKYTVLYIKYYSSVAEYNNINGKHIYIANARYNMCENDPKTIDYNMSMLVADVNIIHTMDLYTKVKYTGKEVFLDGSND